MASPFAMFRRNQQTLLVVLFILAIFAFTLSDLLTSQTVNLPMLGLIVGTCILTAVGAVVKQPAKYAAIGALGGFVVGYAASLIVTPNAPDTVATTKFGAISKTDVERILSERNAANEFINFAAHEAVGQEMANQLIAAFSFRIPGATSEEEAVLSFLLLEEAKRLGIDIDNTAVSDYINRATQNRLSKTAYNKVIGSIPITDGQLFQILKDQIAIRTVQQQLAPAGFMTPEQYWEMFKKLNFKQRIQTVAVPVAALAKEISKPDESELKAFFEEHKNNYPGRPNPESVGFRQQRKVQIAYLEANYLDLEATVDEVTDREIEEHYEEYKDPLYLNRRVPERSFGDGDPFSGNPGSGITGPDLGDPNTPGPKLDLDSLIPNAVPDPEAPLKADKPDSSEPDTDDDPSSDLPEVPDEQDKSAEDKSSEPESQSRIAPPAAALQPVSFLQEEKETAKESTDDTGNQEPPEDKKKAETKAADTNENESASATAEDSPDKPSESETEPPGSNVIPPAPETDLEAPLRAPRPAPPKYQPLDDDLRDEIRDTLLRQRTNDKQEELAGLVLERMAQLSDDYFALQDKEAIEEFAKQESVKEFAQQKIKELKQQSEQRTEELKKFEDLTVNDGKNLSVNDAKNLFVKYAQHELQALAQQHGLTYGQTPLMRFSDLSLSDEYPIGSATIGIEQSNTNRETVAEYVFKMPAESVYEANAARSPEPNSIYVFWKTADREPHVPSWEEEDIRETVLEAWRMEQARPQAEKRAEEIKQKLSGTDKTWSEYLVENPETVTGAKDGVLLQPLISDSFSWYTLERSSVPIMSGFSLPADLPVLTDLSTVDNAGPEFMEQVFNDMQPGDIDVVPNRDHSVYYVVQVRDRQPSTPEGRQFQLERFLSAELFPNSFLPTPYTALVSGEARELYRAWLDELKDKYDVEMFEPGNGERS